MKSAITILSIFIFSIFISDFAFAGRCSGGAGCTACSNCSSCKNCSEEGGTCSVCSNYDEPEPQAEVVPVPVVESEPEPQPEVSDYYEETPKKEESGYGWVWWTGGVIGFLVLVGALGKK